MSTCPCGTQKTYDSCCGVFITGQQVAPTAEALMRSRYSAYVKHVIDYVEATNDPESPDEFDRGAAKNWAEQTEWMGLDVMATDGGAPTDDEGIVEFVARFRINGKELSHHEISTFKRREGKWYYFDGKTKNTPFVRVAPKLGRNDPCHCGSGKKFKKCHGE